MQTRFGKIAVLAAALSLLCAGGGVGGYGVWHHASGIIAAKDAALSGASAKLRQAEAGLSVERAAVSAAWHRQMATERQLAKTEETLKLALAAQAGVEELVKTVNGLTGKIRFAPAKAQKPVEKPQGNAPAVPAPVPAPVKPAPSAPKKVEPQAVAGTVDPAAMVAAHNRWRSEVGVPGLKWSDKLADVAQGWADHLAGNNCAMYHSGNGYGENIYKAGPMVWTDGRREVWPVHPRQVVDHWGNESKQRDNATGRCSGVCGHYTQVVWKDTDEVGCGMAVCGNKAQIWVCNYSPAGNVVGEKPY